MTQALPLRTRAGAIHHPQRRRMSSLSHQARSIFAETMRRVDVRSAVHRHLHCDASTLTLGDTTIPLPELDQLLILALGKAAIPMYQTAHELLTIAPLPRHALVIAPNRRDRPLSPTPFFSPARIPSQTPAPSALPRPLSLCSAAPPRAPPFSSS